MYNITSFITGKHTLCKLKKGTWLRIPRDKTQLRHILQLTFDTESEEEVEGTKHQVTQHQRVYKHN